MQVDLKRCPSGVVAVRNLAFSSDNDKGESGVCRTEFSGRNAHYKGRQFGFLPESLQVSECSRSGS